MSQSSRMLVVVALCGCAPQAAERVALERGDGGRLDGQSAEVAPGSGGGGGSDTGGPIGSGGLVATGGGGGRGSGGAGGVVATGGAGGAATGGAGTATGGAGGTPPAGGGAGGDDMASPDLAVDNAPVEAAPDTAGKPVAFLVAANPTSLEAADTRVKTLLEQKGYVVKMGDDDAMGSASNGTQLVVLSGTCDSMKLMNKYISIPINTLVLEPGVFDDMGMTGATATDLGSENATQVTIVKTDSPLAAKLTGNVTVVGSQQKLAWGKPADTAIKVATLSNMSQKHAVFAYDKGVLMVSPALAPAKRVGLFITATAIGSLNDNGNKLLAAAIDWLK